MPPSLEYVYSNFAFMSLVHTSHVYYTQIKCMLSTYVATNLVTIKHWVISIQLHACTATS